MAIAKAAAVADHTNTESTEGSEPISNRAGTTGTISGETQTQSQTQGTEKRKAEEMGDGMDVDSGAASGLAVTEQQAETADRAVKQLKVDLD